MRLIDPIKLLGEALMAAPTGDDAEREQTDQEKVESFGHVGVNFEGGKIVAHALRSPLCAGYSNVQIVMDAPFHGRVAGEAVRRAGRSETQFSGYDPELLSRGLRLVLSAAVDRCKAATSAAPARLVLQIARGRTANEFFEREVAPVLQQLAPVQIQVFNGYRSTTYFPLPKVAPGDGVDATARSTRRGGGRRRSVGGGAGTAFVLVNIGMFACLSKSALALAPGTVCIPHRTIDIAFRAGGGSEETSGSKNGEQQQRRRQGRLAIVGSRKHDDDIGALASTSQLNGGKLLPRLTLLGIADDMPFVTPEHYSEADFAAVLGDGADGTHRCSFSDIRG